MYWFELSATICVHTHYFSYVCAYFFYVCVVCKLPYTFRQQCHNGRIAVICRIYRDGVEIKPAPTGEGFVLARRLLSVTFPFDGLKGLSAPSNNSYPLK